AVRNSGTLTLTRCTFSHNLAAGGAGNMGGTLVGAGLGGGLANVVAVLSDLFGGGTPSVTISNSVFSDNQAVGGAGAVGGNGGDALGGGIANLFGATLTV